MFIRAQGRVESHRDLSFHGSVYKVRRALLASYSVSQPDENLPTQIRINVLAEHIP